MSTAGGVLAIDQGTSSTKALLVDRGGRIVARASRPSITLTPQPGWAEQDGRALWEAVVGVIGDIVAAGHPIAGLAIANQRETAGLWDRSGDPAAPFVLWQCRRTGPLCDALRDRQDDIEARTGLAVDPMFSATKLAWLLDRTPGGRTRAASGDLLVGTVDSWLLWKLTGGAVHATDHTNASRTQLMNLETLAWDAALADLFGVPLAALPEIRPSRGVFGRVRGGVTGLPDGLPICAMLGDSHASLYGHGIRGPGAIKATCGTGSSLMTVTDRRIRSGHGLSSTIAWSEPGRALHALEGNIVVSGQGLTIVAGLLGLPDEAALFDLAATVEDSGGVSLVPAFSGMGAPHWRSEARGLIAGMTLGTRPAHLARAAIDAVALQIRDVFAAMEADLDRPLDALSVDGGAAASDMLAQTLADILDRPVRRPASQDLSALGAARLGAEALGLRMDGGDGEDRLFAPAAPPERLRRTLDSWAEALERTML